MLDVITFKKRCMKTSLRFVLRAALFLFPIGAGAVTWSSVITSEKMRAEVDLASFLRQGNIVTAWDREVYAVLEQARPGDFYFKSSKTLMRYNCSGRTADLLMRVYYAEDGSEITTVSASYYGKPNYVIPDTNAELKFDYACQYKTPEEKKLAAATAAEATARKKSEKLAESGEAGELVEAPTKKTLAGGKVKSAAAGSPVKPLTRSLPVIKPPSTLARSPGAASKGEK